MVNKQNPIGGILAFNRRWVVRDMSFFDWLEYLKTYTPMQIFCVDEKHPPEFIFIKKPVKLS